MCTGFLLEDGTFVTARHCIDIAPSSLDFNAAETRGVDITFHFTGRSYDKKINFGFTNRQMNSTANLDRQTWRRLNDGSSVRIREPMYFNGTDWAYLQTGYSGGVPFDKQLSSNLEAGTELIVLGYSYGSKNRQGGNLEPNFSTAKVTRSGLQNGMIHVTEAGFDKGNSGGPVFTVNAKGEAIAIGIVSAILLKDEITQMGDVVQIDSNEKIITSLSNMQK